MSLRSRASRAVLSSPTSAIDAPRDSVVVTTAVTTQALSTFIGQLLVVFADHRWFETLVSNDDATVVRRRHDGAVLSTTSAQRRERCSDEFMLPSWHA